MVPLSSSILVLVFVVLMILLLPNFMQLVPYIADSFLRARGSSALENSVRVSRDRNTVALVMLLPAQLLIFRYRLYNPDFLAWRSGDSRIWLIAAAFGVYLLLRVVIYVLLKPRRRYSGIPITHTAPQFKLYILYSLMPAPAKTEVRAVSVTS